MCVSSFVLITDDWKFTAIFKNNYYFDNLTDTKRLFCDFAHLCINIIDPKWSPLIFTAEQCTRIWSLVYLLPSGGFFENWRFLYRLLQMLPTVCPVLYAKNPDYSAVLWSAKWINTHLDVCFLWIILFRSQDSWGLNFDPCNALNKSWISNTRCPAGNMRCPCCTSASVTGGVVSLTHCLKETSPPLVFSVASRLSVVVAWNKRGQIQIL